MQKLQIHPQKVVLFQFHPQMNVLLVFHPQNPLFVWVYPQKGTSQLKHPQLSKKGFYSPIYEIKPLLNGSGLNNVLSNKTILFDILDFWCHLVVIRFVKTLSKLCMFASFMKISACWLLHRLIKFNKICWEKRPAKPRPNLRTWFCRRDLKNTQPHLKWKPGPGIQSWISKLWFQISWNY